jgi:cation diffusion facilitator family transporter
VNSATRRSIRWAQAGLLINAVLVLVKLFAGIIGHASALVADAVESSSDIFSSLIVWMGLSIAARPADEDHPYGHGKAEPLAAAVVSLMLLGRRWGFRSCRFVRFTRRSTSRRHSRSSSLRA